MKKIKAIAFYLPQFHEIEENNEWWGSGFTEWTNVKKAKPLFDGHYQPHVPTEELGYYNLSNIEVQKKQIKMAKENGIYGFCYYHYWFGGKKLLEKPLQNLLKNSELDFPFCVCWANENWTRRWDGLDSEILIAQDHSNEDDLNFIKDMMPILKDSRYIEINGKKLLLVYRTELLPDAKKTAKIWRDEARKNGIDLYLARVESFSSKTNPMEIDFDAAVEFAPDWKNIGNTIITSKNTNRYQEILKKIPKQEPPYIHDYAVSIERMLTKETPSYKLFRGVFPSWDNTARKGEKGAIFINSDPNKFEYFLKNTIKYTLDQFNDNECLIFINAWNEWGEGCHLEPDINNNKLYLEVCKKYFLENGIGSSELRYAGMKNFSTFLLNELVFEEEKSKYLFREMGYISEELKQNDKDLQKKDGDLQKINQDLYDTRTSLRWKIPNYLYKFYKKNLKKFIPKFVFELKDELFMIANKLVFNIKKINLKKIHNAIIPGDPSVIIGIASYNHAKYLEKCIQSALNQTYRKYDIVIVDDNSSDAKNREILQKYEDNPKIKIIYKERNEGISVSLNDQVLNSGGDWVAFLDCDDYLPENALAEMAIYIKNNPLKKLVFSNRIEVDENDKFLQKVWFGDRYKENKMFDELLKGMVSSHLKLIHKDAFLKVGLFDERFGGTHDLDMFLRIAFYMPRAFGFIDKYLYYHRIHERQNTTVEGDKHKENVKKIIAEALFRKKVYSGNFEELISIIILSFNRGERTKKTIEKLLVYARNIKKEIIIWDNGSDDDKTLEILKELAKKDEIVVYFSKENLRCSGGRKEGAKIAKGDLLYFLDNDIEIEKGALEELIIRMHENNNIAGACSKVTFPNERIQFNGGQYFKNDDFISFVLIDTGKSRTDISAMKKIECGWIPGGATIFRREIFDRIEHDVAYINAFEDNDFSLQITEKLNMQVVNCPTSRVVHHHLNFEQFLDEGTKKYKAVRKDDNNAFINSWKRFYDKWGMIIKDDFILGITGLKEKSKEEIKKYLNKSI